MKVTEIVRQKVQEFSDGKVFTYDDFSIDENTESAFKVALFRMVKLGEIERLSKGRFYKPVKGIAGNLKPDEYEVVKDLLFANEKIVGYITGYTIFNDLGLTTQMSNIIQIGANFDKKKIRRGKYTIKFVRQWNAINADNIYQLQLLDSIRFIKRIPDTTIDKSLKRLLYLIRKIHTDELGRFVELALNYPPSVRSLTGALLEKLGYIKLSDKLRKSLRATSYFSIDISGDIIPDKRKWRIR